MHLSFYQASLFLLVSNHTENIVLELVYLKTSHEEKQNHTLCTSPLSGLNQLKYLSMCSLTTFEFLWNNRNENGMKF